MKTIYDHIREQLLLEREVSDLEKVVIEYGSAKDIWKKKIKNCKMKNMLNKDKKKQCVVRWTRWYLGHLQRLLNTKCTKVKRRESCYRIIVAEVDRVTKKVR